MRAGSIASAPNGVTSAPTIAFHSSSAFAGSVRNSSKPSSPPNPVRDRNTSTPATFTGSVRKRKYLRAPTSSSVSFCTTSRERGPLPPRCAPRALHRVGEEAEVPEGADVVVGQLLPALARAGADHAQVRHPRRDPLELDVEVLQRLAE